MKNKIQDAYSSSKNIYNTVLDRRSILSRLYTDIFWSGTNDREIAERMLAWIPDDFAGHLLDVPAGTAVFTQRKWRALKGADITCLDYSADMLDQARAQLYDCGHIRFVQGDVGNLPMDSASYDMVVSMNGFHAFPDKDKALSEICRVLKPGGIFMASFYVRGKSARTDWLVRHILSAKGWFTPPFLTEEEARSKLAGSFWETELHTDGSILYFRCVRL